MKEETIKTIKGFRVEIDAFIKKNDELFTGLCSDVTEQFEDVNEVMANRQLAKRALEDASMRLGKVLQHIGNPNPYPNSRNPDNAIVDPTADTSSSSDEEDAKEDETSL